MKKYHLNKNELSLIIIIVGIWHMLYYYVYVNNYIAINNNTNIYKSNLERFIYEQSAQIVVYFTVIYYMAIFLCKHKVKLLHFLFLPVSLIIFVSSMIFTLLPVQVFIYSLYERNEPVNNFLFIILLPFSVALTTILFSLNRAFIEKFSLSVTSIAYRVLFAIMAVLFTIIVSYPYRAITIAHKDMIITMAQHLNDEDLPGLHGKILELALHNVFILSLQLFLYYCSWKGFKNLNNSDEGQIGHASSLRE